MALRASYYGVKRNLKDELHKLDGIIPGDVSQLNPLASQAEIEGIWYVNSFTGVHNLIPATLSSLKTDNVTGTWADNAYTHNGVTFTVITDDNGYVTSITTSGTSAGTATMFVNRSMIFKAGESYCLSGSAITTSNEVWLGTYNLSSSNYEFNSKHGDEKVFSYESNSDRGIRIRIGTGINTTGLAFYPMIRYSVDTTKTYGPYSATNHELTVAISTINGILDDHKTEINAIISAATGAADFAAFKTAMEALTPLTRSIPASDTRSIPEEDPEEVTEEPTTKKRTTKKTVKEGE